MSMKLTIIAILLSTTLACANSNCQSCTSRIVNLTITEICTNCKTNFLVNSDGGCSMNLAKLISMVFIGLVIIVLSLVLRWILIELNSKKKPVYTADYQNKIYQYMNERKSFQQATATNASQKSQRNLLTNTQIMEQRLCGICNKDIAHGNKKIDTITSCKHHFHALCLKTSMNEQLFNDPNNLSKCPQCKQTLYEMKIYCQDCKARRRNVLMEDKYSLCKVNSFVCFRCYNEKRWKIKEGREKLCCGMGRYFCCYCVRDF